MPICAIIQQVFPYINSLEKKTQSPEYADV